MAAPENAKAGFVREKDLFADLMGKPFPGKDGLDPADEICPKCGDHLEEWAGQFESAEEIDMYDPDHNNEEQLRTLLASVTERTGEIGIRRALGARRRSITFQFLVETVLLSSIGGVIGVLVGAAIPLIVSRLADIEPVALVSREHASAALAVCDYADQHDIDLIVIGSHGRTGLRRLLIGSVAEKTVRHANCPVMVVPHRKS